MISIIVAATTKLAIGKDNKLLWDLPTDLKHFKDLTIDKRVIMGRKTWESIPSKFRPLPRRQNIVISRDYDYKSEGALNISDLTQFIAEYKSSSTNDSLIEDFVIGGSQIYKQFFPIAKKLYLTEVLSEIEGDTYLEGFDYDEWELIYKSETFVENDLKFIFKEYIRK